LILSIIIFITGCSAIKKGKFSNYELAGKSGSDSLLKRIVTQNLTNRNFYIQKAEIEILTEDDNQKLIVSLKYEYYGKYLISIKSRAGIEVARIFITNDTILMNDRLNRRLYYGEPKDLISRYGISADIIPVILGDFIYEKRKLKENVLCVDGKINLYSTIRGLKVGYIVDCKRNKIIEAEQKDSLGNKVLDIEYGSFIKINEFLIASKILISYKNSKMNIKIRKMDSPWNGIIQFIPGNKYSLIKIL